MEVRTGAEAEGSYLRLVMSRHPSTALVAGLRRRVRTAPVLGPVLVKAKLWADLQRRKWRFTNSADYWDERYAAGGNSGAGSYNRLAEFKAEVLNGLVRDGAIRSVIEWGCGDGNQLRLAEYPKYVGLDVSRVAVQRCRHLFAGDPSKRFSLVHDYRGEKFEMAISLDVIFHLVEDDVYQRYIHDLFSSAQRCVVIYSSDSDAVNTDPHVRHREFTRHVQMEVPEWRLVRRIPNRYPMRDDPDNESLADFFIYEKA